MSFFKSKLFIKYNIMSLALLLIFVLVSGYSAFAKGRSDICIDTSKSFVIDRAGVVYTGSQASSLFNANHGIYNAYCLEPSVSAPGIKKSYAGYFVTDENLRKLLFYSYNSPGYYQKNLECNKLFDAAFSSARNSVDVNRYLCSHYMLGYYYADVLGMASKANWYSGLSGQYSSDYAKCTGQIKAVIDAANSILEFPNSDIDKFTAYYIETTSKTQPIITWEYDNTGYLRIHKNSSDESVTADNDKYSFEGAEYGVAMMNKDGNIYLVAGLTIGADGYSETIPLMYGEYYINEMKAPMGYEKDEGWYTVRITADNHSESLAFTQELYEVPKVGSVSLVKRPESGCEYVKDNPNYNLDGAVYYIVSRSTYTDNGEDYHKIRLRLTLNSKGNVKKAERINELTGEEKSLKEGEGLIREDGKLYISNIPYDVYYYWESEDNSMKGYAVNMNVSEENYLNNYIILDETNNSALIETEDPAPTDPFYLELHKVDANGKKLEGAGSLEGAIFTVKYYAEDTDKVEKLTDLTTEPVAVYEIKTDSKGFTCIDDEYIVSKKGEEFSEDGVISLPYGIITIEETKAPKGYTLKGRCFEDVNGEGGSIYFAKIVEESSEPRIKAYNRFSDTDGKLILTVKENVIRGDMEFTKKDSDTNQCMAGVQFILKSETTGESHVIITDENGYYSSSSKYALHSLDTNGGRMNSGTWFGNTEDINDGMGALPYDKYSLIEIECEGNEGYHLADKIEFEISKDSTVITLPDILNKQKPMPVISTQAFQFDTGDKYITGDGPIMVYDKVSCENLEIGKEYRLEGFFLDSETGDRMDIIECSRTFTANASKQDEIMSFKFEADMYRGKRPVIYELLYDGDKLIASHTDIDSTEQTVLIPKIGTSAADEDGDSYVKPGSIAKLTDRVEYENLCPGRKYIIKGSLVDKRNANILSVDGRNLEVTREFVPDEEDGFVDVLFEVDTGKIGCDTFVVFEELYEEEGLRYVTKHADVNSDEQTIYVDKVIKTGDVVMIGLSVILFAISGAAVILLILKKRRGNVKE